MGVLEALGVSAETYSAIEEQKVGGTSSVVTPGVYEVVVEKVYIRKTDKGAKMLEVDFATKDGEAIHYATCIQSGDEKGNKTTYVKDGKEHPMPGLIDMKHFFEATGNANPDPVEGQVKHGDSTITALCVPSLTGSIIKIGLRNEEDEYNGNTIMKNLIETFMTRDGKNSKGEEIETEVAEKIAKNPIKKPRGKKAPAAAIATPDAAAAQASGW